MIRIRPIVIVNPVAYLIMLPVALLLKWLVVVAIYIMKWVILGTISLINKLCVFARRRLPILCNKIKTGVPALYRRCAPVMTRRH